jgi:hypothetical protein
MRLVGRAAREGKVKSAYNFLAGRPEGKISLERPSCKWEANIKMDLKHIGCEDVYWIQMV